MAILDRPLFQRRPTKDELRQYGIPAFANGGVVGMGPGQSLAMTGGIGYASVPKPKTAEELLEEDYGKLGKVLAGEKAKTARELEAKQQERLLLEQAKFDSERAKKEQADKEAMALLREKEEKKEEKKKDDFLRSPAKEGSDTIDRTTEDIGKEESELSDLDALKKKYLEKSKLYKELLGNPEEMNRRQGFLQLAQFGLNLASAQGSNFLDKVAKSAKDPLNAFAELGRKAYEDERAVNLLALEATEKDISAEQESELKKELALIAKDGDSDTDFQKNLATIDTQLGDSVDTLTKVRIARGLSAGDSREDRIYSVLETISDLPLNLGKDQSVLIKEATDLVDFVSGGSEGDAPETSKTPITEEMIKATMDKNPNIDREVIIKDLESKGYDVSNLK